MRKMICAVLTLAALSTDVYALESFVGKVTVVEPTYLPTGVAFTMDTGNTACPAGTWLWWNKPDQQNNKAIYAALLAAMLTDKPVRFRINDGDAQCVGQYLHVLK